MSDLVRTQAVEGWTLGYVESEIEPRVRVDDLGARLGYARVRELRQLVREHEHAGNVKPFHVRGVAPRAGAVPVVDDEMWLSREDGLFIVTKSGKPLAIALTKEMIRVFLAVQDGRLAAVPSDLEAMIARAVRAALAEREAFGGLIGGGRAERLILSELRTICTLGAQRGSKAWRANHRRLQNELRDGLRGVPHRGAWRDIPERYLGDIRSALVLMRQAAERAGGPQLVLIVAPKPGLLPPKEG